MEKVKVVTTYEKDLGKNGSLIYYPGEYNATPELKAELEAAGVLYKEPEPEPEHDVLPIEAEPQGEPDEDDELLEDLEDEEIE